MKKSNFFVGICLIILNCANGQAPSFKLASAISVTANPIPQGTYVTVTATFQNNSATAGYFDFECDLETSSGTFQTVFGKQCNTYVAGSSNVTLTFSKTSGGATDVNPANVAPGSYRIRMIVSANGGSCIPACGNKPSACISQVASGNFTNPLPVTVTSPFCGGTTNLTSCAGSFDDGSGSANYGNNYDCYWLIQPTGASSITLSFSSFATESAPYDYVKIYNGTNTSGTLLGNFSGTSLPSSVTSGSSMYVWFHSDGATVAQGWSANYSCTSSCSAPTTQASGITFSGIGTTSMTVNWTSGNGSRRVVKMNTVNTFTAPADGTDPTANSTYSGSGQQVVYNSTGNGTTISGLTAGTTYWFRVYEANCTGSSSLYRTTTGTNNPNSQATTMACVAPTTQASGITFSGVGTTSMTVNWTNGDGSRRVVKMNTANTFTAPADGTDPTATSTYSGSGQQVVYNSTGNSATISGLTAGTTYWFRVYEANCTGSSSLYRTTTATNNPNSQATTTSCVAPTTQASGITFSGVGTTSMTVNWTNGDGSRRVVKMNTANTFTAPADGTDPTATSTYSGSGQQVVYNSTGNSATISGLTAGTTYWFRVYEANCTSSSSLYRITTGTNNPNSQATSTVTTVTGTISSTLGTGYFIQGISTVNNTFTTTPNPSTNVNKVIFTAGNTTYTDNSSGGGWTATFDMGQLAPGTIVTAAYYDGSTLLGTSSSYSLNILAKPAWLDYANVNVISVSSGNINMNVSYPFQNSSSFVPYSVKGLGGKDFSLINNALAFDVVFNRTSRNSTISNPLLGLLLNTLDEATQAFDISIPANLSTDLRLDNNFNLLATVSADLQTPHLSADYHGIPIALDPLGTIAVSVDAGISIYGALKARLVIGSSGSQWGFVDNGGDRTRVTAKVEPEAHINGNVHILYGALSAHATLDVVGRVGGGFEYVTVPSLQTFPLFGGDIEISGTASAYALWNLIPIKHFGPTTFYYGMFGDTSALRQLNNTLEQNFGASSVTYHLDGTHVLPDNNPQPCIATRGNNLFAAWVENDSTTGYLCFAKLDTSGNAFTPKTVITTNQNSIATPKIAAMEDGSALFSWSQNRYTESTLPNGISTFEALKAQDIWFGFYDASSNSVTKISLMQDDTSSFQSGRLEGEASTAFGDNEGMITWVVKDPISAGSDIWFAQIAKNGGNLTSTTPSKLFDLPGTNRNVNVVFTDSVNALAVWINDPDAIDSTLNSEVVFSEWNGTSWSTPLPMSSNNGNSVFSEVSMNHNNSYTVAAFTSTVIDANSKFSKRIEITAWNDATKQWNASQGIVEVDSFNYTTKPTVAINKMGIATVTYQVQNKYLDSTYIDPGELYLFTKDLNSNNPWSKISGNEYLCDSSTYVWELASGFSSGNRFYTLTQEYNATGIVSNPKNGIIFGDPNLSLVLRGLRINNDMTISDIAEPRGIVGIVKQSLNNFNLLQNYPNPFTKSTFIEFGITKSSLVTLEVYNISGIKVASLLNQILPEGIYKTIFDAGNLESGVYFYKLIVDGNSSSRKMILVK